jgi:hypothetical protein
MSLVSIYCP